MCTPIKCQCDCFHSEVTCGSEMKVTQARYFIQPPLGFLRLLRSLVIINFHCSVKLSDPIFLLRQMVSGYFKILIPQF